MWRQATATTTTAATAKDCEEGEQTCGGDRGITIPVGGSESGEHASDQERGDGGEVVPTRGGQTRREEERALGAWARHVHDDWVKEGGGMKNRETKRSLVERGAAVHVGDHAIATALAVLTVLATAAAAAAVTRV